MSSTTGPSRRFSLPSRLLVNSIPAAQPSLDFDPEPTPSSSQISSPDNQKAQSLFRRLNRRSKIVFGLGSDMDFGCAGEVGGKKGGKGHGRSVSSSAFTASYAVKNSAPASTTSTRRSSTSSNPPSLTHSRATSSSSQISASSETSTAPSSISQSPVNSPGRYSFPTTTARSPISPRRLSTASESKRKSEEVAAIEALNDYFVKVKLDRVEEDSSTTSQTTWESFRSGSSVDSTEEGERDEEDGAMHISFLNIGAPGISSTTYAAPPTDFSHDNSHSTFSPSLPTPYSPASSPHLSVLSATSTLHPLTQSSHFAHSPILDVGYELDSLSDYFASPVQSLRSSPISTPTPSAPFISTPPTTTTTTSVGRKTHSRARTVSSSISRNLAQEELGRERSGGRSMSSSAGSDKAARVPRVAYGWI